MQYDSLMEVIMIGRHCLDPTGSSGPGRHFCLLRNEF